MESCKHCKQDTDRFTEDGYAVCEACAPDYCTLCELREPEHDLSDGAACRRCYASLIDNQYERE